MYASRVVLQLAHGFSSLTTAKASTYPMPSFCLPLAMASICCITLLIAFVQTGNSLGTALQPGLLYVEGRAGCGYVWVAMLVGRLMLIVFNSLKFIKIGDIVFILD